MSGGLHSTPSGDSSDSSAAGGPTRTCIGCRTRGSRTDLLRVVVEEGRIVPDPRGRLPGRGAWMHPGCVEIAERRKAFGRALRVSGPVDLGPLHRWLDEHVTTRPSSPEASG